MKVAYLINQYPMVSHAFIRREVLALERAGIEVMRFALRGWDAPVVDPADRVELQRTRFVLREGLRGLMGPVLRVTAAAPGRALSAIRQAIWQWRAFDRTLAHNLVSVAEACRLLEWLREADVSHVHAHFGTNSAYVAMLCRLLGGPSFSFTVHGPDEWDQARSLGLDRKIQQARFVVAISQFARGQLHRWARPDDRDKVAVVHCGLESEFTIDDAGPAPDVTRLVCVGRLCPAKGQSELLDAVATLRREGIDLELVLAGDGEARSDLEAKIERLALKDSVRITGWISSAQVRAEITAARALVLPSFAEGLPVVIMEAMALRRPVIATMIAAIPELVRDRSEGWLVPAGSQEDLVAALRSCMETPIASLQEMGERGRNRVMRRHCVDRQAALLAGLFAATQS